MARYIYIYIIIEVCALSLGPTLQINSKTCWSSIREDKNDLKIS